MVYATHQHQEFTLAIVRVDLMVIIVKVEYISAIKIPPIVAQEPVKNRNLAV